MKSTGQFRLFERIFSTILVAVLIFFIFRSYILCKKTTEGRKFGSQKRKYLNRAYRNLSRVSTRKNWKFEGTPDFCKRIVNHPRKYNACVMDENTKLCEDGQSTMFSQFFQDFYLYTRHFAKLQRRGVYVDLAANHPWKISNSFFMDSCLGWDGICIEANPLYISDLKQQRSCNVVHRCISDNDKHNVSFVLNGGGSGLAVTNKNMEILKRNGKAIHHISMMCTTLAKLFKRFDLSFVDYLSLDVEGHELSILRGINWKMVQINVITIELSRKTKEGIEKFMNRKGYSRHIPVLNEESKTTGLLKEDGIFIRDDVIFGYPS